MNVFHFSELIFLTFVACTSAGRLSLNAGNYIVEWTHLPVTQEIEFNITAKTTGWVGLGISKENTGMKKLDAFIGGYNNGAPYLKDYYVTFTTTPTADTKQDLTLISSSENNGVTNIRFRRKLDTGDTAQDHAIKDYHSMTTTKPTKDSQQDYTLVSATQTNGSTVVEFKRKLKTGDEKDIEMVPGKSYYIAWAFQSTPGPLGYHGKQLRGYSAVKVVLAGASPTEKPTTTAASVSCSSVVLLWALAAALIVR
ncbi:hypothetical protein QZH41_020285 [Actinostola sp. cb2023]|nr:hypothetical protein QZH41_020285 [Actinostola sp. cb2023]